MRSRIRSRVANGLKDLSILLDHLEQRDLATVVGNSETFDGIADGYGFLTWALFEAQDIDETQLQTILERAITRALTQRDELVEHVLVNVEIERADETIPDDLSELPDHLLRQLLFTGEITSLEFADAVQAKEPEKRETEAERRARYLAKSLKESVARSSTRPRRQEQVEEIAEKVAKDTEEDVNKQTTE